MTESSNPDCFFTPEAGEIENSAIEVVGREEALAEDDRHAEPDQDELNARWWTGKPCGW
jgi:hypothetical protein